MLPAVEKGLAASGRRPDEFEIVPTVMIATGRTGEEIAAAEAGVAGLVAFYGSTPAYRPLLELEGLGELHQELFGLSRRGRWAEMAGLVDRDVMDRFAVRGGPADIGLEVARRYGDLARRINTYLPYDAPLDLQSEVAASLHRAGGEGPQD
jgi:alkanesulfonate monooxygenase SsuD/methylene tetrahydromethanopterin reductase-like flavin-dependent oxidoreductase (luciferase family)